MALGILERIKGFLFNPSDTFNASRGDTIGDAFKYFVVILAIYAVLSAILVAVAFSLFAGMLSMFGVPAMPFGAAMGPLVGVGVFVAMIIGGIIAVLISGLWLHIWVYLVGGRNGVGQTINAVIYGQTPYLLLGWIPIINFIALLWALIVEIIGVRQLQVLSTGKAVLAVILALLIPAIIVGIGIVTMSPTMLGPGFTGPVGPRYGGFP